MRGNYNEIKPFRPPPDAAKVEALTDYILFLREHIPCVKCKEERLVWWYNRLGERVDVLDYARRGVAKYRIRFLLKSTYRPLCDTCVSDMSKKVRAAMPNASQAKKGIGPAAPKDPAISRLDGICAMLRGKAIREESKTERAKLWRKHAYYQGQLRKLEDIGKESDAINLEDMMYDGEIPSRLTDEDV